MARTLEQISDPAGVTPSTFGSTIRPLGYDVDRDGRIVYRGVRVAELANDVGLYSDEVAAMLRAMGWRVDAGGRARWSRPRGEANPSAKLTAAAVREIRAANGVSLAELLRQYGVRPKAIQRARDRETWRHVI
jgi:hypothetical protein